MPRNFSKQHFGAAPVGIPCTVLVVTSLKGFCRAGRRLEEGFSYQGKLKNRPIQVGRHDSGY